MLWLWMALAWGGNVIVHDAVGTSIVLPGLDVWCLAVPAPADGNPYVCERVFDDPEAYQRWLRADRPPTVMVSGFLVRGDRLFHVDIDAQRAAIHGVTGPERDVDRTVSGIAEDLGVHFYDGHRYELSTLEDGRRAGYMWPRVDGYEVAYWWIAGEGNVAEVFVDGGPGMRDEARALGETIVDALVMPTLEVEEPRRGFPFRLRWIVLLGVGAVGLFYRFVTLQGRPY